MDTKPTYEDLRRLQDAMVTLDPNNLEDANALELLKEQHERARKALAGSLPQEDVPALADKTLIRPPKSLLSRAREVAAVGAMAPAKGVAGMVDLAATADQWMTKRINGSDPRPHPQLSKKVDDLTNWLGHTSGTAGDLGDVEKIPMSTGRAVGEGAISALLGGGPKAAAAVAGGAAGGTAEELQQRGAPWYAQLLGALLAGQVGRLPQLRGQSAGDALAAGRINRAREGVTDEQLLRGAPNVREGQAAGMTLLPSQAADVPNAASVRGLQQLEAALLGSRASKADAFRTQTGEQAERVRTLAEELRNISGQAPRLEDELADALKGLTTSYVKEGGDAVNAATKSLYKSTSAQQQMGPMWSAYRAKQVEQQFEEALIKYRANGAAVTALQEAKTRLLGLLKDRRKPVTPEELETAMSDVIRDLPAYTAMTPSSANLARGAVTDAMKDLRTRVDTLSPELKQARELQAQLRGDLLSDTSPIVRAAQGTGAPDAYLTRAMRSPEVMGLVEQRNPRLAQELRQRFVNQVLDNALKKESTSGLGKPQVGIEIQNQLNDTAGGKMVMQGLENLFYSAPDPKAAAEGFRRIVRVMANASKPVGRQTDSALRSLNPAEAQYQTTRLTRATEQVDNALGFAGRSAANLYNNLRDNATIDILTRPDVMERLVAMGKVPAPRITQSTILATVPQLFQEP